MPCALTLRRTRKSSEVHDGRQPMASRRVVLAAGSSFLVPGAFDVEVYISDTVNGEPRKHCTEQAHSHPWHLNEQTV